jgi:hypothetical protein
MLRRWPLTVRTVVTLGIAGSLLYGGWMLSTMLHTLRTVQHLLAMQQSQLMIQQHTQFQAQATNVKLLQWMGTHLRSPQCDGPEPTRFAGTDPSLGRGR